MNRKRIITICCTLLFVFGIANISYAAEMRDPIGSIYNSSVSYNIPVYFYGDSIGCVTVTANFEYGDHYVKVLNISPSMHYGSPYIVRDESGILDSQIIPINSAEQKVKVQFQFKVENLETGHVGYARPTVEFNIVGGAFTYSTHSDYANLGGCRCQ